MKRILVLGGGMAAGKLVQELVGLGSQDEILVAGQEGPGIYNRILLAKAITHDMGDDFWTVPAPWFAENKVRFLAGHRAEVIDRTNKTVAFAGGARESYDTLVLALGSRPFRPPVPGIDLPGIHVLRSLEDVVSLQKELAAPRRILVVGGGLLGLETAQEFQGAGHRVTVVHAVPGLMERHLDTIGAGYLKAHLEAAGMTILTDDLCTEFQAEEGRVTRALLRSGTFLDTDLVLLSAGVFPETALAKAAGLETARGIVVDDSLATSDPSIFAVGECLEWRGRTWGLLSSVYDQARFLARVLVGQEAQFVPTDDPPTRLKSSVFAASMGRLKAEDGDEAFEVRDPLRGAYKKVVVRDGKIVGAQAVGTLSEDDPDRWDEVELAYASGQVLGRSPGQMLFRSGTQDAASPKTWADNLKVCQCNGVTAGEIRAAVAAGSVSVEAVMKVTKAGTGCSTCRSRLRALVESEVGAKAEKRGAWKRFVRAYREKEIRGFTPYWIVSYILDYLMLVSAVIVVLTGLLKFPGLLGALGFSIRRLPMDLFMVLHDWAGLAMSAAVLVHLVIHWGMMVSFLRSMFKKKR